MHETNVKSAVIPQSKPMSSLMMADYRLKRVAINMANRGRVNLNLCPLLLQCYVAMVITGFSSCQHSTDTDRKHLQMPLFFVTKPTRCTNFTNLFCHEIVHVSDSSSVHHQEFIHCTLSNGTCHTGL